VLFACGGGSAAAPGPAATPAPAPAAPPSFDYDATAPLDRADDGAAQRWDGIAIQPITYASPRGGRVRALVVAPDAAGTTRPAVILQHGKGVDKTALLGDAEVYARAGAVVVLIDAPDQRPAAMRIRDYADHGHDDELVVHTAVDLRRTVDLLIARGDVDAARIGFAGHSFGATQGAILAAIEPRIRALALIAPGDVTHVLRHGLTEELVGLRATIPPAAFDGYLAMMAPFDASVFLAKARPDAAVLLQFGAYDAGTTADVDASLAARSTARTEHHRYPTGHAITSIPAVCDRAAFFSRELGLPASDACARRPER
jgi:dienelactone hydrolase